MSLDQAIKYKKEKRKPYHGAKSIDPTCRNHGSCFWCKGNRLHKRMQEKERAKDMKNEEKSANDNL